MSVLGAKAVWVGRATIAVLARPSLWVVAARQVGLLAPDRWWRTSPFLPVPDRSYFRFRMQTMYGDPDRAPEPGDVVTYLRWCRAWPQVASSST